MRSFLVGLVLCVVAVWFAGSARGQCVEDWRFGPAQAYPGLVGTVYAMTVHDDGRGPAMYFGGDFEAIGGVVTRNIARWDGANWEAMPGGGTDGPVYALASYGGELMLGGDFDHAGDATVQNIASFSDFGWRSLNGGLVGGAVRALLVRDGKVFVGGDFRASFQQPGAYITSWDGESWQYVVRTMSAVKALAEWRGSLVAVGNRLDFGVDGIGVLNASHWEALGTGMTGTSGAINALAVYNDELIAAGEFTSIGGTAVASIGRWDGVSWTALGSAVSGSPDLYALAVHDGSLFVGGEFAGLGVVSQDLVRWDGAAWKAADDAQTLQFLALHGVRALMPFGGRLIIGGQATDPGPGFFARAFGLWQWNAGGVEAATGGVNHPINQLYDDGGDVLAVGEFLIGDWGSVARLDGDRWAPIPGQFDQLTRTILRHDGRLVVGGDFKKVDGITVNDVTRQGPSAWEPMGAGFNAKVRQLIEFRGDLIAAGGFSMSGTTPVNRIARWDGSAWTNLGQGFDGSVFVMTIYNDELIAAGEFMTADGQPAVNIAAWNGSAWRPLGAGTPNRTLALTVYQGSLIAGGFSSAMRWNGSGWSAMPGGPSLGSLAVHHDELFGAGNALWRWNGASWVQASAGRMDGTLPGIEPNGARTLLSHGRELLVGGSFIEVDAHPPYADMNGRLSAYFARWGCAACIADVNEDGLTDFGDYLEFLNRYDAQDLSVDFNGDGLIDFGDYLEFLSVYSEGCP